VRESKLMKVNRNHTALAITAYVLIDVLIRTSQAVWGAVSNVNKASRLPTYTLYDLFGRNMVLGVAATGLAILSIALILLLIFYFVKVWSNATRLARSLVRILVAGGADNIEQSDPDNIKSSDLDSLEQPVPDNIHRSEQWALLKEIFGEDYVEAKAPFWRLISALMMTWLLVILIEFLSNLIPFQS
jgi:hypothetical protein